MLKICLAANAAVVAALLVAASPAQALVVRAWVSGKGSDIAGCGAPANACRTLQYTHDHIVSAGGEIDILDPAGYGTLTITKAISIVNDGVGTAGVQTNNGDAITINAGLNDAVYLRGLNIDGLGSGFSGIDFKAGGSLTVVNCVVRHFGFDGLFINPAAGALTISISDSIFQNNGSMGIQYLATGTAAANVVVNRVTADNNDTGIGVINENSSAATRFTITNSDASNNTTVGMSAENVATGDLHVEINTSTAENNTRWGLFVNKTADTHIARSVFDFNGEYGINNSSTAPGAVYSSGDSHLEGNGIDAILGSALAVDTMH
jgi:hypothetical protein